MSPGARRATVFCTRITGSGQSRWRASRTCRLTGSQVPLVRNFVGTQRRDLQGPRRSAALGDGDRHALGLAPLAEAGGEPRGELEILGVRLAVDQRERSRVA